VKTPTDPKLEIQENEQRPLLPLSAMISIAPAESFGGWGPCMVGSPSVRTSLN